MTISGRLFWNIAQNTGSNKYWGGGRIRLHFHPGMGENKGVDAVEPASSNSPPDCCI